jgi:hypothetical protein
MISAAAFAATLGGWGAIANSTQGEAAAYTAQASLAQGAVAGRVSTLRQVTLPVTRPAALATTRSSR